MYLPGPHERHDAAARIGAVERQVGKFELGHNRSEADARGAADARGDSALGRLMRGE
ncbi:MAG TPA: hypothetical protein PLZ50_10070 [Rubrivivax sp.]|jgi:hypothetical protein|nr:hypothetical protein [Pseudomonadota bacterium]HOL36932.1 hypothetical protein [Rubrivivax sp.]HPP83892.1 hypothetical protein [Rubrivivax sp.]